MKKTYLSDWIGDDFKHWYQKKILLTAPTGAGKSTFIINTLLPYLIEKRRKLLILCNRRLLRKEYWYSLVMKFDFYDELSSSVELRTYQELSEQIQETNDISGLFSGFDVIVCDECHYFYADSDFNGLGTYTLLQAIVLTGLNRTMIFLSATMEEVGPLIDVTIKNCQAKRSRGNRAYIYELQQPIFLRYGNREEYDRFDCICVPDYESLCQKIAKSDKKSVVFIDSKKKANELKEIFLKKFGVSGSKIALLNAENLDDDSNSNLVRELALAHRISCKILITTSVLDNGVSIHDPDVGNISIITESRLSFIQMLGRIRSENIARCKLYFVLRSYSDFLRRMNRSQNELNQFEELEKRNYSLDAFSVVNEVWNRPDLETGKFYLKALIPMRHDLQLFDMPKTKARIVYGNSAFYLNEFCKKKIADMYLMESRLYKLAVEDPINVVYEQMAWIGKMPDELINEEETYLIERKKQLINTLLNVRQYDKSQLQEVKEKLVKDFHKDLLSNIPAKNGTLSSEKLEVICKRYGLRLLKREGSDRRILYSIEKENAGS